MATKNRPSLASAKKDPQLPLFNDAGLVGMYADVFLVAGQPDTGILSIAFFQSDLVTDSMDASIKTEIQGKQRANMVSRILLSQKGAAILLAALQNHVIVKTEEPK